MIDGVSRQIGRAEECGHLIPYEGVEANGRLMAAAPEMLAALVYVEQFDGAALSKEQVATICKRASAVIAKVEGK
jgi:hypothetical protein